MDEKSYTLITDKNELESTCYFEFLPGQYKDKCWNDGSVFLSEESIAIFEDILLEIDPSYDHYAFIEWNQDKIKKLISELKARIRSIKESNRLNITTPYFSASFYERMHKDIVEYKETIIKMLSDLHTWLAVTIKDYNIISILGM